MNYFNKIPTIIYDGQVAKPARQLNDDVQVVWDIDADGWRSFRYDSVKTLLRE